MTASREPSDNSETLISSELLYDGRIVHLYKETVRLPDGNTVTREVIRHPGAVAMVAIERGDVILVRQYRLPTHQMLLEVPAGTLEPGEDPLLCANRELQEEIGYKADSLTPLGGIFTAPGYTSEYIHFFMATGLHESRLAADADEFIEVVRIPFADALNRIKSGEIRDGKTIAALLSAQLYGLPITY